MTAATNSRTWRLQVHPEANQQAQIKLLCVFVCVSVSVQVVELKPETLSVAAGGAEGNWEPLKQKPIPELEVSCSHVSS